jgi:hypothetical protein
MYKSTKACPDNCSDKSCDKVCTKCNPGYGDINNKPDASGNCSIYNTTYKVVGTLNTNKCEKQAGSQADIISSPPNIKTQNVCEQTCGQTQSCNAYDWDSVKYTCDLWSGNVEADPTQDSSKNHTCYKKITSSS